MSSKPKPPSKPFFICGVHDLERAFGFANATFTKPTLVVYARHIMFWGHQNFTTMLHAAAQKHHIQTPQKNIDYDLIIDTENLKNQAIAALLSPIVSFVIFSQNPPSHSLSLLAQQYHITLTSHIHS